MPLAGMFRPAAYLLFAALCIIPIDAGGQAPARAEVERTVRAWFDAWNSGDVEKIAAREDAGAPGFGYRTRASRQFTKEQNAKVVRDFFASMEYFRISIDEIHTAVDGDVGLAWGFYTEEFQVRGRAPEKVRARFTQTFRRERSGWRVLMYHRDAQPFDGNGRYLPLPPMK